MIASLHGVLAAKNQDHVVVNVHGVGYRVWVSLETLCKLPDLHSEVTLTVHTHVRDDAIHLYGFHSEFEKRMFLHLIGVSGIGPRMALNILSRIPDRQLGSAIEARDVRRLQAIPGIGKKTAERILVELSEKIGKERDHLALEQVPYPEGNMMRDALSALENLGYRLDHVRPVVQRVLMDSGDDPKLEDIIRRTLRAFDQSG